MARQALQTVAGEGGFAPLEEEIERYGLADEIRALDETGLCVVAPAKTRVSPDFVERATTRLLAVAERRTGARFDVHKGKTGRVDDRGEEIGHFTVGHLLFEGDVFEEIYVNPVRKTVMRYLLGDKHRLSSGKGWIKFKTPSTHQGRFTTPLHGDTAAPKPWPTATPHVTNSNWILTDYTRENGALCYVPGSHRLGRPPGPGEGHEDAIPVEAPAGSILIFNGCTWHGAVPKETEGLRLSIHGFFCRSYYLPQEDYRGRVPAEMFERSRDPDYLRMLMREDEFDMRPPPAA